ncbi:hypothetical protein C2S53_006274 [Perilla frutescens var. hirtella]|uniref:Arginine decarboxylase n=1 Tax=Perilla frutescens var. hirtella TaxID=608512 RepID=A0AAD4ITS6_PERFH|nr:hypothetical protein C2S53_006274 [Perilla frutescens var. hirtella]
MVQNSTTTTMIEKIFPSPSDCELPPLVRTLKASAERNGVAFHFPGHKRGEAAPSTLTELIGTKPFLHDVTEIPELDRFFCPEGPLLEAKTLAARLFGAKETWFLVSGTSSGVQAAIMATCSPGDTIILPRNAHISATNGVVFSGALPKYIVPEYCPEWDICAGIRPLQVETAIKESKIAGQKVGAVFITSPTYNGICSNLIEISRICHSQGIPLIVDEAHGAHFKFHPEMPETALEQGADISIQSTHKVLCSFSQSSMLHLSGDIVDRERLHKCIHSLQSTSPNWLLLASLDASRHQLSISSETIFNEAVKLADEAKTLIGAIPGISILGVSTFTSFPFMDPLRITIGVWRLGLSGFEARGILDNEFGVVPEFGGTSSVTLAFSLGTTDEHVQRLVSALKGISDTFLPRCRGKDRFCVSGDDIYGGAVAELSPREAFFAVKTKKELMESVGEVCGECIYPYPPGIPVVVPGEVITEKAVSYLLQIKRHGGVIYGTDDPLLDSIVVCERGGE